MNNKLKVSSYTQRGREKEHHEDIITDEYWTEHKNLDGSNLKVKVSLNAQAYHEDKTMEDMKLIGEYLVKVRNFIRSEHKTSACNEFFKDWDKQEEFDKLEERIFHDNSEIVEI